MTFKPGLDVTDTNPMPVKIVTSSEPFKLGAPITDSNPMPVGGGAGGGATMTINRSTVPSNTTGDVAQLAAGLTGTLTWSKLSGAASVAIAAGTGVVSLSSGLAPAATAAFTARVQNGAGDAIEKSFLLTGAAAIVALTATPTNPTITTMTAKGSLVSTIGNVPAGVTPTLTPNDDRFVIAGNSADGWKVVLGLSAISTGNVDIVVAAAGATSITIPTTITAPAAIAPDNPFGTISLTGQPSYAVVNQPFSYGGPTATGNSGAVSYTFTPSPTSPASIPGLAFSSINGGFSGTPTALGYIWGVIEGTDGTGATGRIPVMVNSIPASQTLAASGDATGAADAAAINAVTRAGAGSVEYPANSTIYLSEAVEWVSNNAIILGAGCVVNIIGQTNFVRNLNRGSQTRVNRNFVLWGKDGGTQPVVNGQFNNQDIPASGQVRDVQGVLGLSAQGFRCHNVKVTARAGAFHALGSVDWVCDKFIPMDTGRVNQDGFDVGSGSANGFVEDAVNGGAKDDYVSIYAKTAQSATSMMGSSVWQDGADVTNLWFRNLTGKFKLTNCFRVQSGNGFKLDGLFIDIVEQQASAAEATSRWFMQFGRAGYLTDSSFASGAGDFRNIRANRIKGFEVYASFDVHAKDRSGAANMLTIANIEQNVQLTRGVCNGGESGAAGAWIVEGVNIKNVVDTYVGTHSTVFTFATTTLTKNLSFSNLAFTSLSRIDTSVAPVTNLTIDGLAVGTPTNPLFAGATGSTGTIKNLTIANPIPVTYGVAVGYVLGPNVPKVRPYDTIPQPIAGSAVTFTNGITPAGQDGTSQGGDYTANGTAWTRSTTASVPYPDARVFFSHNVVGATAGTALSALTPQIGGAYTGLTGATNTSPPIVNTAGDGLRSQGGSNGNRSGVAAPGLNVRGRMKARYKGVLATDNFGFGIHSVSGSNTILLCRYNAAAGTGGAGAYEVIALVNGTSLGTLITYDSPAGTSDRYFGVVSRVDSLTNPTVRSVQLEVEGVLVGPVVTITDQALIKIGSGAAANAGAPAWKWGAIQGAATGRHPYELIVETI